MLLLKPQGPRKRVITEAPRRRLCGEGCLTVAVVAGRGLKLTVTLQEGSQRNKCLFPVLFLTFDFFQCHPFSLSTKWKREGERAIDSVSQPPGPSCWEKKGRKWTARISAKKLEHCILVVTYIQNYCESVIVIDECLIWDYYIIFWRGHWGSNLGPYAARQVLCYWSKSPTPVT